MRIPSARYTAPFIFIALLVTLVLAAPRIARYSLVNFINDELDVAVSIADLELDMLDGEVRIHHLQVSGDSGSELRGAQLYADIDLGALFRRDLIVEKVSLEGIRLQVVRSPTGETVIVVPLTSSEEGDTAKSIELPLFELLELSIVDAELNIDLPPLRGRFRVAEASLSMLTTLSQASARLQITGDWNGAPLVVNGSLAPFEEIPWFEGELSLQRAELREVEAYLPTTLTGLGGTLDTRWQGRVSSDGFAMDGELRFHEPVIDLDNLQAYGSTLAWQGTLKASGYPDLLTYSVAGDWKGTGLGIADRARGITLIELSEFLAGGLSTDERGALAIAELELDTIRAVDRGGEEQQLLQGRKMRVRDLEYRDNALRVGSIFGEDVVSNLYFTADSGLVARGVLTTSLETLRTKQDDAEQAPPLQWRLQETTMRNSQLTVVDQQFDPPFRLKLAVEELQVGVLDSVQPESPAVLNLKARVGEFGRIDIAGQISALAPESNTVLKGSIQSLALPEMSPYSEYLLGYELVAGQFDHDFEFSIKDAHITASNDLTLRKTRVKKLKDVQPAAPLPMPLNMALDVLRDKQDRIVLSVPLEGRLDDPEVGLDQVISRALGKALRGGSTAFLKLVLQPYGAIWTGVEFGMKQAGKVRLDPMAFPPGSPELGHSQLEYAAKLGELLSDRPRIELQLCGEAGSDDYGTLQPQKASPGDGTETSGTQPTTAPEQRRQMLELAELRAGALKRWLITEKNIAPERLYPCKPVADLNSKVSGIRLSL